MAFWAVLIRLLSAVYLTQSPLSFLRYPMTVVPYSPLREAVDALRAGLPVVVVQHIFLLLDRKSVV